MTMDYVEAIMGVAQHHMTEGGYELLLKIEDKMPDIWDRPSSSTGKYHQKSDGKVPSIAHHTYEMLYAGCKIIRMFGGKLKSTKNDTYIMAIILHDIQKYGKKGTQPHTSKTHDRDMANLLTKNIKTLMTHFTLEEAQKLIMGVRYHSGRWSPDVVNMLEFDFNDYPPIVMFIHTLDMLSTGDCLKFPEINN